MPRLLLLSSSRVSTHEGWLTYALPAIKDFLGPNVSKVLFVPFAAVTISWDEYEDRAREQFASIGYQLRSLHRSGKPIETLGRSEAIVVGGGNTFHLLETLKKGHLINPPGQLSPLRKRIREGVPYIGWSAGANLACPTIRTTNDMPICWPSDPGGLNLIPFQINPHFTDALPPGHHGETRSDRLREYIEENRDVDVVGFPEGDILRVENDEMTLIGPHPISVFRYGREPRIVSSEESVQFLLKE